MVTGKNKEQFEKWYEKQTYPNTEVEDALLPLSPFNNLDIRHQIGVYLAYYDSLGYFIEVRMFETPKDWIYQIWGEDIMSPLFKMAEMDIREIPETRGEAYKEAFKQADLIINK
jgi:hypothetical protein